MYPISGDVADILVNSHIVSESDVFVNEFGEQDAQVLIVDTGGYESGLPGVYEKNTFQLIVRGKRNESNLESYRLAYDLLDYLVNLFDNEINDQRYDCFQVINGINNLGRDEEDRFLWSINFFTYR